MTMVNEKEKIGQHTSQGIVLDGFINTRQACRLSRLKQAIITRYCREGRFKAISIGKQWMIDEQDFVEWLYASRSGRKHKKRGMPEIGYISVREAAEMSGLSDSIITRYCRQQRIQASNAGKQWMVNKKEFLRWLKKPRPVGRSKASQLKK